MTPFQAALIPLVPALTALAWALVHQLQHRKAASQSEASQTASTGQVAQTTGQGVPPVSGSNGSKL